MPEVGLQRWSRLRTSSSAQLSPTDAADLHELDVDGDTVQLRATVWPSDSEFHHVISVSLYTLPKVPKHVWVMRQKLTHAIN